MIFKFELQNIISGNGSVRYGKIIQTINHVLRAEKKAVSGFEKPKFLKDQEAKILLDYIEHNNFWICIKDFVYEYSGRKNRDNEVDFGN